MSSKPVGGAFGERSGGESIVVTNLTLLPVQPLFNGEPLGHVRRTSEGSGSATRQQSRGEPINTANDEIMEMWSNRRRVWSDASASCSCASYVGRTRLYYIYVKQHTASNGFLIGTLSLGKTRTQTIDGANQEIDVVSRKL